MGQAIILTAPKKSEGTKNNGRPKQHATVIFGQQSSLLFRPSHILISHITALRPPPPAPDTVGTIPGVEETKMEQVAVELPPSPPMAQAPQAASPAPRRPAPQQHALKPARAARPLPVPELDVGLLRRLELAARPGGRPRSYDVLTSPERCAACACRRSVLWCS